MEKKKSIYSVLVVISVVLSVVVSLCVSLVLRKMISGEITGMKKMELRASSDRMHVLFDSRRENLEKKLSVIQDKIDWSGISSKDEIFKRLSEAQEEAELYSVILAKTSGETIYSAGNNSSVSLSSEKNALKAAAGGKLNSCLSLKNDEVLATAAAKISGDKRKCPFDSAGNFRPRMDFGIRLHARMQYEHLYRRHLR